MWQFLAQCRNWNQRCIHLLQYRCQITQGLQFKWKKILIRSLSFVRDNTVIIVKVANDAIESETFLQCSFRKALVLSCISDTIQYLQY